MVENALTQQQLGPDFITRIQVADMTILFTDMAGTMRLLDQMPPEEALTLLYTYMNAIAQILVDHGATLQSVEGRAPVKLGALCPRSGRGTLSLPSGERRPPRRTMPGRAAWRLWPSRPK